jgi:hypothetical protein
MTPDLVEQRDPIQQAVLAERLRCSDHISRCVLVGFDSPEERDHYQTILDTLAVDLMSPGSGPVPPGEELGALLARLQKRLELAYLQVQKLEHEARMAESEAILAETRRLIRRHEP